MITDEYKQLLEARAKELGIREEDIVNASMRLISLMSVEELKYFINDMNNTGSCDNMDRPCCGGECGSK